MVESCGLEETSLEAGSDGPGVVACGGEGRVVGSEARGGIEAGRMGWWFRGCEEMCMERRVRRSEIVCASSIVFAVEAVPRLLVRGLGRCPV